MVVRIDLRQHLPSWQIFLQADLRVRKEKADVEEKEREVGVL